MWIIERPNGTQEHLGASPYGDDGLALARVGPFVRAAEADRAPAADGTEDWDFAAGAWKINPMRAEAWIDRTHALTHGDHAIQMARLEKRIEAGLILAGVPYRGLLVAEAAATGQDVEELARTVMAAAEAERAAEVGRIRAKRHARDR